MVEIQFDLALELRFFFSNSASSYIKEGLIVASSAVVKVK